MEPEPLAPCTSHLWIPAAQVGASTGAQSSHGSDLPFSLHVQGAFRLPRQACAKAFLTSRDEGGINFDAASFRHRPIILLRRSAMIAEHESKT